MENKPSLCSECQVLGYCKQMQFIKNEQNHSLKIAGLIAKLRRLTGDVSANVENEEAEALTGKSLDELTESTRAVARSMGCPNTHLF